MNLNLIAYFLYSLITIYTIVYVGRVLHRNGRHYILKILKDESFGDFINNGLLVGYYLVNIGYVFITITAWEKIEHGIALVEVLGAKVGTIFLLLGGMHIFNIIALKIYADYINRTEFMA